MTGFLSRDGNHAPHPPFTLNQDSQQARGLVGWWPFSPEGGDIIRDVSGFSRHGTWIFGNKWDGNELGQRGLNFDGNADEVNMGDVLNFDTNDPFSLMVQIKYLIASVNTTEALISKMGPSANRGYTTTLERTGEKRLQFFHISTFPSNHNVVEIDDFFEPAGGLNTIFQLVFTNAGTNAASGMKIYSNGLDQSAVVFNDTLSATTSHTGDCLLGNRADISTQEFSGIMYEARIYNVELTATEVWNMYNPSTRWDLYHELGRKTYLFSAAAGALNLVMAPYRPA